MATKTLVAYFSASGVTEKVAQKLASAIGAGLHEIQPKVPYTSADLDWRDKKSRSSIEMSDKSSRPEIANKVADMDSYDTIYIGYPVWWYVAPTIINTFLEEYDFSGKTVVPFCTSGSSGIGNVKEYLLPSCKGANLKSGKRFAANVSEKELKAWAENY